MSAPGLSVVVITLDEERSIGRCLSSVKDLADDIVVVDSGSRDRTVEIARTFTDRVYTRPFDDYATQKNHALSLASCRWILSLDADEELTPRLRGQIRAATTASDGPAAYRLRRRSHIFGRRFVATGTREDSPVRLFRAGSARFEGSIHERAVTKGPVASLSAPLEHHTYASLRDYWERLNRYTSMEALRYEREGRRLAPSGMIWKPPAMFLRLYVWKLGFLDGVQGFLFSGLSAYYLFLKQAKFHERAGR